MPRAWPLCSGLHSARTERSRHERHLTGSRMVVGIGRQVVSARAVDGSARHGATGGRDRGATGRGAGIPRAGADPCCEGDVPHRAARLRRHPVPAVRRCAGRTEGRMARARPTARTCRSSGRPMGWRSHRSSVPVPGCSSSPPSWASSSASSPGRRSRGPRGAAGRRARHRGHHRGIRLAGTGPPGIDPRREPPQHQRRRHARTPHRAAGLQQSVH